jgi:hypothetical protein
MKAKSKGGIKVYYKGGSVKEMSDDELMEGIKSGSVRVAKQTFRYGGMLKASNDMRNKNTDGGGKKK